MIRSLFLLLAALLLVPLPAAAAVGDGVTVSRLQFAPGASGTRVKGRIRGYEVRTYVVGARAGQTMRVTLETANRSASFNVLPPGSSEAIFIGSIAGNSFTGQLARSGDFVISVGLMRRAARRGAVADYRLTVEIAGGRESWRDPPKNDFADSLMGGPDEWRVVGVPPGDRLNIRTKPFANAPIRASVPNGTRLANGGCRIVEGSRWCMVDLPGGSGISGWANGRYLRE